MPLTDLEFRACHIILSAARCGALFDELKKQMRREGIGDFYDKLGFKILVAGEGDDAEQYVYPGINVISFAPRAVAKCKWRERDAARQVGVRDWR